MLKLKCFRLNSKCFKMIDSSYSKLKKICVHFEWLSYYYYYYYYNIIKIYQKHVDAKSRSCTLIFDKSRGNDIVRSPKCSIISYASAPLVYLGDKWTARASTFDVSIIRRTIVHPSRSLASICPLHSTWRLSDEPIGRLPRKLPLIFQRSSVKRRSKWFCVFHRIFLRHMYNCKDINSHREKYTLLYTFTTKSENKFCYYAFNWQ